MLAVVDCVLLRPVALPHPEQLVTLALENARDHTSGTLSYSQIESLRRNTQSFSAISGYFNMLRPVSTTDGNRTALLTEVTPDFFTMLGVHPKFGRLITSQDEKSSVAVVSAAFWRDRLRADPKAIGSTIKFNGQLHIVIGVLPEGTQFPQGIEVPVVYSPIVLSAKQGDDLFTGYASVLARLKPGASTEQARGEAQSVLAHARTKDSPPQETLILRSYQQHSLAPDWCVSVSGRLQTLAAPQQAFIRRTPQHGTTGRKNNRTLEARHGSKKSRAGGHCLCIRGPAVSRLPRSLSCSLLTS
jgi:hypothetical protein